MLMTMQSSNNIFHDEYLQCLDNCLKRNYSLEPVPRSWGLIEQKRKCINTEIANRVGVHCAPFLVCLHIFYHSFGLHNFPSLSKNRMLYNNNIIVLIILMKCQNIYDDIKFSQNGSQVLQFMNIWRRMLRNFITSDTITTITQSIVIFIYTP